MRKRVARKKRRRAATDRKKRVVRTTRKKTRARGLEAVIRLKRIYNF
jgi:hypothetical protein